MRSSRHRLQGIASFLFVVFVGALWSRPRRAEPEPGPSALVALRGLGSAIVILVSSGILLALIDAAHERREPEAMRALFDLDEIVFLVFGSTSAAFHAGAALSSLATGSLPRWLGWLAALLAAVFVVTFPSIFTEDDEGGVLGAIFFVATS